MIFLNPHIPCTEKCNAFWEHYFDPVTADFKKVDLPAMIHLEEFRDMDDYMAKIHFNKRYGYKQAKKKGYFVEQFNWHSFIGDVVEVNTSKEVRCGGPMRPNYLQTVEQLGGFIKQYRSPDPIPCLKHCYLNFGVFKAMPGHKQGEVVVDKKLLGYIGAIILGDYSLYSMIIGHGDYLKDDIMALLHIESMRFIWTQTGAKYLEYGQMCSGGKGLKAWKEYFLFKETQAQWTRNK